MGALDVFRRRKIVDHERSSPFRSISIPSDGVRHRPTNGFSGHDALRDLSLHGCYIQMISPLPPGTNIILQISVGTSVFQATGLVIHSQVNDGFGVEFDRERIDASSLALLESWLTEARGLIASEDAG